MSSKPRRSIRERSYFDGKGRMAVPYFFQLVARTASSKGLPWDGSVSRLGLEFSSCREAIPAGMLFQLGM